MAFRLKPDRSVSSEIRRIVLRQLETAISELKTVGDPESDEAIHDARRRVKKIRSVIRLVRPVLEQSSAAVDKDLRDISHLLAPVADGQGVIATLDQIDRRYHGLLPKQVVASIRAGLVDRGARADRQAWTEQVLETAAAALRAERRHVKEWRLRADGFRAIAPGLEQSVRRARNAMMKAWARPTAAHYHAWRRHVKDHWFHLRLLEGPCANRLAPDQRRLEALDGMLGEYHNLVLLRHVLATESRVSRAQTIQCLRIVSSYQRVLRQHAQSLGARMYAEKPRRFVRRVKQLWGPATPAAAAGEELAP